MIKTVSEKTVETVRERERERESKSSKIGFSFDAKKLIKYIEIKRIDFLNVKKRIKLLRESLSFL